MTEKKSIPESKEDLQKLIMENTEYENELKNEIIKGAPISAKVPFDTLISQYAGNKFFKGLQNIGKTHKFLRHSRRDGNCFYRSYLIQLFEFLSPKYKGPEAEKIETKLRDSKAHLLLAKYDEIAFEDSYDLLIREIDRVKKLEPEKFEEGLIDIVSNVETSNYLLFFVRMITAAYIKNNSEFFMNFIIDETVEEYCQSQVEHFDHDCDHIQILALTSYMESGVIIHTPREEGQVETMKFPEDAKEFPVSMLYLPGHYDPLYCN